MPNPSGETDSNVRRQHRLQKLMPFRVREVLLVASRYDAYILEEEGKVTDLILKEYDRLNLRYAPRLNATARATEALDLLDSDRRFDMVIVTLHPHEMDPADFAREVRRRHPRLPVVLLGYDNRELQELRESADASAFDRIFIWTGDARILLALVSLIEDERNVEHDTAVAGVEVILFVEDSIHFISSFLPILYGKLLEQSQRLISEGVNVADSVLRMRARPKVLLASTYDEAWTLYQRYRQNILGLISDVSFFHDDGGDHESAGAKLAQRIRRDHPDLPILLQSSDPGNHRLARALDVGFLNKQSPHLTSGLEHFMRAAFGFGPFVFRRPDGTEVGQANSLAELRDRLETVPAESIQYHSDRNHFSAWLKARAEFRLADQLRPRRVDHFPDLEAMRRRVVADLDDYRRDSYRDVISEFRPETFGTLSSFARIGGGSLGGKARGLAFLNTLLHSHPETSVEIVVPPTVAIGTQFFDAFIEENGLADFAANAAPDEEVRQAFLAASLPAALMDKLLSLATRMPYPCAVRSSSLLEDSQYEPFAGVYETYMLANQSPDPAVRAAEFASAIKLVYASTFTERARTSLAATPHRPEKEKMAVIIQQLIGCERGDIFYPSVSGVAQSYNYYPHGHVRPTDGAARVAVGLGKLVVEGAGGVRFSPRAPKHLPQGSAVEDILDNAQRVFDALPLRPDEADPHRRFQPRRYPIERTHDDPSLAFVRSVYSRDDHTVTDGEGRPGTRLVTFAGVLKHDLFPLAKLLRGLLDLGSTAMSTPVEIEFAIELPDPVTKTPARFACLQFRPMAVARELTRVDLDQIAPASIFCESDRVLGNGRIEDVRDVVWVDPERFDRKHSRDVADVVARLNAQLLAAKRPYLLIGPGRWGSADPWLGIPVHWGQIAGARIVVETSLPGIPVVPSQGSHFFHNLTTRHVAYLTVAPDLGSGSIDFPWLLAQPTRYADELGVGWTELPVPLLGLIDGEGQRAIVVKRHDLLAAADR